MILVQKNILQLNQKYAIFVLLLPLFFLFRVIHGVVQIVSFAAFLKSSRFHEN